MSSKPKQDEREEVPVGDPMGLTATRRDIKLFIGNTNLSNYPKIHVRISTREGFEEFEQDIIKVIASKKVPMDKAFEIVEKESKD